MKGKKHGLERGGREKKGRRGKNKAQVGRNRKEQLGECLVKWKG